MERGRAKGHISVRRGLFVQASKGNIPALTFLAKHLPGYRDAWSNKHSGPNDPPTGKRFSGSLQELLELYRSATEEDEGRAYLDAEQAATSGKHG
jgi:hypothetical protein